MKKRLIYGYSTLFNYNEESDIIIEPRRHILDQLCLRQDIKIPIIKKCLIKSNEYTDILLYKLDENSYCTTKPSQFDSRESVYTTSLENIAQSYNLDSFDLIINFKVDNILDIIKLSPNIHQIYILESLDIDLVDHSFLLSDATDNYTIYQNMDHHESSKIIGKFNFCIFGSQIPAYIESLANKTRSQIVYSNHKIYHQAVSDLYDQCENKDLPFVFVDGKRGDQKLCNMLFGKKMTMPRCTAIYSDTTKTVWYASPTTMVYITSQFHSDIFTDYIQKAQDNRKTVFPMLSKSYFFYFFEARCSLVTIEKH